MSEIEKFPLTSMDITEEQKQKLKQLFPEVFTEGDKIDWDKLRLTLGETVDVGKERFGMNWPGKADCFKIIQQPSLATLIPARDESINFDSTENLFIEGDNLEVLKLLQKSYLGKIKVIYIDPPYNTGNDFIYPDNYSESLETYLAYTGQVDSEGRKFSTNTDTEGRFHSKWMNMMYPRLFLAKNLLKDDGVIFISIDDSEVKNLRSICDDIFGEENFIAELIWDLGTGTAAGHFTRAHEYILVFARDKNTLSNFRYYGDDDIISERAIKKISKGNPASRITFPPTIEYEGGDRIFRDQLGVAEVVKIIDGEMIFKKGKLSKEVTLEAGWAMRNQILSWLDGKETFDSKGQRVKRFFFDKNGVLQYEKERGFINPQSVLRKIASTRKGSSEIENLMGGRFFEFPKPVDLLKFIIQTVSYQDIVLDYFAGSCTTAQAILELNKKNGGNRKFICAQLPEPTNENSEAYQAGYKSIADIGKERIRRVIKKIEEEQKQNVDMFKEENPPLDLGFKVFKLAPSNFSSWDANVDKTAEAIGKQLELHITHISESADQEAILYELLLKSGFELTTKIEKLEIEGKAVFSIGEGELLICLERALTNELIKAMAERKPVRVICLDEGFQNNDQLKTNAALIMKSQGVVKFQTV